MKSKQWFEVSREGLRELQAGKSKDFVLREVVQNAWDENISNCLVHIERCGSKLVEITVEDDSPEGFCDITHAFTLFAPTYKRKDPEKRGRFNVGEKQVLALCKKAIISTTKGTIVFSPEGRIHKRLKRKEGSIISLTLKANGLEYEEMLDSIKLYLPPKRINFAVNGRSVPHREPYRTIKASLPTEIQWYDGVMTTSIRKTDVHIHNPFAKIVLTPTVSDDYHGWLYEMGLPICEIDCPYSIDVQQKVPMSLDRDKVSQKYLQKIFAITLNEVHKEIHPDRSSDSWIREAMGSKRISTDAVKSIVKSRYGNKVIVAVPGDKIGVDKAISSGYRVLYGSELSSQVWANVRKAEAIQSSSVAFPTTFADDIKPAEIDDNMRKVALLAKKIALRHFDKKIAVEFLEWSGCAAQYDSRSSNLRNGTLTFNVKQLGKQFFNPPFNARTIDLILHELAHEKGMHVEASYHQCLSKMAGDLITLAIKEPEFFTKLEE